MAGKNTTVYLDEELVEKISILAAETQRSFNFTLNALLKKALEK